MVNQAKKSQQKNQQANFTPPVIPNKDLFHRFNYTFQASLFLSSLRPHSQITTVVDRKGKRKAVELAGNDQDEREIDFGKLARESMSSGEGMSVHNQLKLDSSIKRSICRVCSTVLVPGLTSRVRLRPNKSHGNTTHTTCLTCSTKRSIPTPPTASQLGQYTLDGAMRRRRREKLARRAKVGFAERELGLGEEGTSGSELGGHVLWKGEERVREWGIVEQRRNEQIVEGDAEALAVECGEEAMQNP